MMPGPVLILHTTEGPTLASAKRALEAKNAWSHWGYDPATDEWEEWIDPDRDDDGVPDRPARSLRNMAGGVQTNNRGKVLQIEIVGYSSYVSQDRYPDWWWDRLAERIAWICDKYSVPRKFPYKFSGSDAYGLKGSVRLTSKQWLEAEGILGHQHVPENTHWDPSVMDQHLGWRLNTIEGEPDMTETEVVGIQKALNHTGLIEPLLVVDGIYGPKTKAAAELVATSEITDHPVNTKHEAAGAHLEAAIEALGL